MRYTLLLLALPCVAQNVSMTTHEEHTAAIIALANAYELKMNGQAQIAKADADVQAAIKAIQASVAKARKECDEMKPKKVLDDSKQQQGQLVCIAPPKAPEPAK